MPISRARLGACAIAFVSVASCSIGSMGTSPASGGPYGHSTSDIAICTHTDEGRATFGNVYLPQSKGSLVLRDVELEKPAGLKLIGSDVIPSTLGVPSVGNAPEYPPALQGDAAIEWARRRPVSGAELASGSRNYLVLGLQLTNPKGSSFKGVAITYKARGRVYRDVLTLEGTLLPWSKTC